MAAIIPITMPKFGLAMTEGKIASWAVAEGAAVRPGDEIADIETSKITNAYESPVAGVLRRHVAPEHEDLPVGALIAVVADADTPDSEIDAFVTEFQAAFESGRGEAASEAAPEPVSVEVAGERVRYMEIGAGHAGPPVILIHGFGGDLNTWLFNQPVLGETHRVIALDLPGHGGSSKQVGAGDVAALAAVLGGFLDVLEIRKASLVGHSLGAAVALQLALDQPDRVASLTLIGPAGLGEAMDSSFTRDFVTVSRRRQFQPVLEKLFFDKSLVTGDMAEEIMRFKRLDGAQAALAAIETANFGGGVQKTVLRDRLARVAVPVQVVWGREDAIIPSEQASGLPASVRTSILERAGHMPHMEKAAEVNRLIANFLPETAN